MLTVATDLKFSLHLYVDLLFNHNFTIKTITVSNLRKKIIEVVDEDIANNLGPNYNWNPVYKIMVHKTPHQYKETYIKGRQNCSYSCSSLQNWIYPL